MNKYQKFTLVLLRVSLGSLFLYSGFSKIVDPAWSAAGFLKGAKTFPELYTWFASPQILPITDFLNEWGQLFIGAALILGVFVRLASVLGAAMMLLYYFPVLSFPFAGEHGYIVDDHIIYAAAFLLLASFRAGRVLGLETWCSKLPVCSKYPSLRKLLG